MIGGLLIEKGVLDVKEIWTPAMTFFWLGLAGLMND